MAKKVFTVKEVAALLKVHTETVLRAIRSGQLEAAQGGRHYKISRHALEAYFKSIGGGRLFEQGPVGPKVGGQPEELWFELESVVPPVELSADIWSMFNEEFHIPFVGQAGERETEQIMAIEYNRIALVLWASSGFYLFTLPLEKFVKIKARYQWAFLTRGARAARAILKKEE